MIESREEKKVKRNWLVGMVKLIKYNEEVVCRDGCRLEDN
jgi:hypothetical protein